MSKLHEKLFNDPSVEWLEENASNFDKIAWKDIASKTYIGEEFIEKHFKTFYDMECMSTISIHQEFSEAFIDKHWDDLDHTFICRWQQLSEGFMESHADTIDWAAASIGQKMSEAFIEKHLSRLDPSGICWYKTLSEGFIAKYSDWIDWDALSKNPRLSIETIEKYKDKVNWAHIATYHDEECLYHLCMFQTLSEGFMEKNFSYLPKKPLAQNQEFSKEFYEKHHHDFDVDWFMNNNKLPWAKELLISKKLDEIMSIFNKVPSEITLDLANSVKKNIDIMTQHLAK